MFQSRNLQIFCRYLYKKVIDMFKFNIMNLKDFFEKSTKLIGERKDIIFKQLEIVGNIEFFDDEDIFLSWKALLKEEYRKTYSTNGKNKFFLITHYLMMKNYNININCNIKFQNVEKRINQHIYLDKYRYCNVDDIRNKINIYIRDILLEGVEKYFIRDQVIDNLFLSQKLQETKNNYWDDNDIDNLSFYSIGKVDENYIEQQICYGLNTIERLLKFNGSYIERDFIVFDNNFIKNTKRKFQIFRHASLDSLEERKKYSIGEKLIILNSLILICKDIKISISKCNP